MVKPVPDDPTPTSIETLNRRLESHFPWGSKDGCDTQTQTQAHDTTQDVWMLMSTLKTGVVIKLSIPWQSNRTPVHLDRRKYRLGCQLRFEGLCHRQSSMERDTGQCINQRTVFNLQVLDDVEGVKLRSPAGNLRQVPTSRGWRETTSSPAIQRTSSFQDATDRTNSWAHDQSRV